ncbi:MAG: type II and III secretion system family protein [Mariprofundaceae bacterium]
MTGINRFNPLPRLISGLCAGLLALSFPAVICAQTEVIRIDHLPLSEAATAARSQLSATGSVAAMPSRGILIVDDDAGHVRRVQALLKKLDAPARQFRARVEIASRQQHAQQGVDVDGALRLPGGWIRVSPQYSAGHGSSRRSYQLQVTAGQPGRIEAGKVYVLPATRRWLQGYGIVSSATTVPVTGGFDIVVRPAGEGMAHVRIQPWLQRLDQNAGFVGRQEVLIDLGSAKTPATPPGNAADAPLRLNASPRAPQGLQGQRIDVVGAATELTIPLDRDVTIAAIDGEAKHMAQALLSGRSQTGSQQMEIHLRVGRN